MPKRKEPDEPKESKRKPGEGSKVLQRKNGTFYASVTSPLTGKRLSVYGKTEREVRDKRTKLLADLADGVVRPSGRKTLGAWLDDWLAMKVPRLKPSTAARYAVLVAQVKAELAGVQIAGLTPHHLEGFYAKVQADGKSSSTARRLHTLIHGALRAAMRFGYLTRNVADLVDPPSDRPQQIRPLSAAEVRTVLRAAEGTPIRTLIAVAVVTGMRIGELLALRWSDIDFAGQAIVVRRTVARLPNQGPVFSEPKSRASRRRIDVDAGTLIALRAHQRTQSPNELVFPDPRRGEVWHHQTLLGIWREVTKRAGLPGGVRLHDLRHTSATLALEAGINPKVVSERLGHASVALTLNTYSHVTPGLQRQVADTLGGLLDE